MNIFTVNFRVKKSLMDVKPKVYIEVKEYIDHIMLYND